MTVGMDPKRPPSELSDEELIEQLKDLVREENEIKVRALADVRAGKYVDPFTLDLLRGDLDDDVVDEIEALNEKRLD